MMLDMTMPENRLSVLVPVGRYELWWRTTEDNLLWGQSRLVGGAMHSHTMYDVHCVAEGSFYIVLEKGSIRVARGTVVIIAPNVLHTTAPDPESECSCHRANFKFSFVKRKALPNDAPSAELHGNALAEVFDTISGCAVISDPIDCVATLKAIAGEFQEKGLGYYQLAQARVLAMLTTLGRQLSRRLNHVTPANRTNTTVQRETIEEFFLLCSCRHCSQQELAEILHISIRQLNRVLDTLFGMSFRKKLMYSRHNRACGMLVAEPDLTIAAVAEQCGYSNVSSFCHAFLRLKGISPAAYRAHELAGAGQEKYS